MENGRTVSIGGVFSALSIPFPEPISIIRLQELSACDPLSPILVRFFLMSMGDVRAQWSGPAIGGGRARNKSGSHIFKWVWYQKAVNIFIPGILYS